MLAAACALAACARPPMRPTPATDALVKALPTPTHSATLKNGLRVLVQEDHHSPLVAVHVVYRVGSAHDPPGRSGFAHLFEHLMFEGSKHVPRGEFDNLLARAGVSHKNAHTTHDLTAYYETLPASQLELALFLESDRMGFLLDTLNQPTLDNVRSVVKNEYRQRYETTSYAAVTPALYAATFPATHPYHRMPIGTLAELDAASLADVRQFFLRWYGPNNATLIVVGDVKGADVLAAARRWFEPIPASPTPPEIPRLPPWKPEKEQRITFQASVLLPKLFMMWPGPAYGEDGDVELTAASELIYWNLSGHLVKKLEIAHSVRTYRNVGRFGSTLHAEILLRQGIAMDKAIDEANEAIDDLSRYARWSIDDKSVREALYGTYSAEVFDLDGPSRRAETFGFFETIAGSVDALPARLRAYEAIDAGLVTDAYREFVLRTPRVIVFVEPKKSAPPGGVLKP